MFIKKNSNFSFQPNQNRNPKANAGETSNLNAKIENTGYV